MTDLVVTNANGSWVAGFIGFAMLCVATALWLWDVWKKGRDGDD